MNAEGQHTCPSCGNEYSGAMEFCPVCMLRMGLAGGIGSGESSVSKEAVECIPERASQRFEHYELLKGADGKPVEEASFKTCAPCHAKATRDFVFTRYAP